MTELDCEEEYNRLSVQLTEALAGLISTSIDGAWSHIRLDVDARLIGKTVVFSGLTLTADLTKRIPVLREYVGGD